MLAVAIFSCQARMSLMMFAGLDCIAKAHLTACEELVQGKFIPLAFESDGVPISWDRKESVQCFTWALPGLANKDF